MTTVAPTSDLSSRYRIEPTVMQALRSPRILTREVLAGLVVAIALIPEAIAFSIIAGVDPRLGLFSSFVMAVAIAFLGGRPAMITAATGAIALVIAPVARDYGMDYFIATVILGGLIQIVLALLGVAKLMRFIPRSVMVGFVNALAILIFISQVPQLLGVPWHAGSMVLAAQGDTTLRAIELDRGNGRERIECDLLAVGWGLVPNMELARLLGCELDVSATHPAVRADLRLRSSHPDIHAAGEALGIGGRDCARIEGAMAACFALGDERGGEALRARRDSERAYAALLRNHFAPAARVHALASPDTLVCRCEDVPMSAARAHADPRQLRLVTRCGMGACQGRICGAALRELQLASPSISPTAVRPPLTPVALATLADLPSDEPEQGTNR